MALNAQQNWNVEMSKISKPSTRAGEACSFSHSNILPRSSISLEIHLPLEIISLIVSLIPRNASNQPVLWACALVSKIWYSASIERLYERPFLSGANFDQFVKTICPSKNAHIRASPLASLVRHLNMGDLAHDASRSLTARLLGRLKSNLELFLAPQVSFSINSLAALSKCTKLRYLNLSLISSSIPNKILFQALRSLGELEILFLPRSSSVNQNDNPCDSYIWPPRLQSLYISGTLDDHFLYTHMTKAPEAFSSLSMQHCPQIRAPAIVFTLYKLGSQLSHLSIRHPMPQIFEGMLDNILKLCPKLISARISIDFFSAKLFKQIPINHTLRSLELGCSHSAESDITPNDIFDAIDQSLLPDLRYIRVSKRLAWDSTPELRSDVEDLSELLDTLEYEHPLHKPSGVWLDLPD
ncbi:F-box protein [Erysiphe neolycopersici]|uniref:F-box protein n=1 Tax=Erysiphe neolycopersici TaxID=212602 RepID=A0A420HUM3_9PEZI|nr:F-box protein [Erysiphe neolycopersici]